jgi:hypothetical protein
MRNTQFDEHFPLEEEPEQSGARKEISQPNDLGGKHSPSSIHHRGFVLGLETLHLPFEVSEYVALHAGFVTEGDLLQARAEIVRSAGRGTWIDHKQEGERALSSIPRGGGAGEREAGGIRFSPDIVL